MVRCLLASPTGATGDGGWATVVATTTPYSNHHSAGGRAGSICFASIRERRSGSRIWARGTEPAR
jgi:hypothetical protein